MKRHVCEETLSRFRKTLQLEIHEGNGFIERAVRTVEEMVRTFKLDLEGRISETLKITRKVIPWLIAHAVDLVNKVQVGQKWENKFRTCPRETAQWRHSPICQSGLDERCWKRFKVELCQKSFLKGCTWG